MQLRFASYNIHKAVGIDRRRDPERIVAVLREFDADVIALQEADLRLGDRAAVLPRALLDDSPWRAAPVSKRPRSMGWHGNAILVRRTLAVGECHALDLPTLEPRGAVCVEIGEGEARFRVIGTHLDLSGLRRRDQVRALLSFVASAPAMPTVILGDFNQWGTSSGAMREFGEEWALVTPGASYPSRRPIARLDRIVHSGNWSLTGNHVHHSALATLASDHLPVHADLNLA
ncbi:endonuclease/exonuclease/phosphatase family protein [Qipengyuania sp.]|uniref:endonuclease/exonuclease/phosphatase family protein n=1 Tax=Qipengyuania sp. TaxID=2004515 RepID=UPI0035C86DE1